VTSLYPSVMLTFGYFPRRDSLGVFRRSCATSAVFRVEAKRSGRSADTAEARAYYEALQTTFKILINSFYGYLGVSLGRFNDYAAANQVTAKGGNCIQQSWVAPCARGHGDRGGIRTASISWRRRTFASLQDEERLLADLTTILQTQPAQTKAVLANEDCLKCHDAPPADIAAAGGKHKDVGCTGCHAGHPPKVKKPHSALQSECHMGKPPLELKGCLACHKNPHTPLNISFAGK